LIPALAALVGVRLFHGLATAVYSPVSMAAVASLAGDRRGESLSWLSNAKTVGGLLGSFLGGVLLSVGVAGALSATLGVDGRPETATAGAFTRAWLVAGGLGCAALAVGIVALRRVKDDPPPATRRSAFGKLVSGMRDVARDGQVLVTSSCEAVQNISVGMLEQFLPIYAVVVAGHSPLEAGILFGVQTLSTVASKPLFGRLSDRRGRRTLVVLGMFACALPFAAMPWTSGMPALLALATLFGLGEALVTAASAALVTDLCEKRSLGAAMGVFGTIGDIGHAAGPLAGGAILAVWAADGAIVAGPEAETGFRVAFGAVAALIAAAGLAFAMLSRPERGAPPAAPRS
jgi:MFS transporter, DHA1 family, multidrug resistance protein